MTYLDIFSAIGRNTRRKHRRLGQVLRAIRTSAPKSTPTSAMELVNEPKPPLALASASAYHGPLHLPGRINKKSRSICANKCGSITNVRCHICKQFLCFTSERNCFAERHKHIEHVPEFIKKRSRSLCKNCKGATNVRCPQCDMYLCFMAKRNCFKEFHL